MSENRSRGPGPPKNGPGQGFPDRPAGEKSRYDPEQEMPDPQQAEKDREEAEKVYRDRKNPAAWRPPILPICAEGHGSSLYHLL